MTAAHTTETAGKCLPVTNLLSLWKPARISLGLSARVYGRKALSRKPLEIVHVSVPRYPLVLAKIVPCRVCGDDQPTWDIPNEHDQRSDASHRRRNRNAGDYRHDRPGCCWSGGRRCGCPRSAR
ncbi:hypothetical protein BVI2075_960095 [Burkholderia vietnamiensis]|nr:hypothetical protein BVI2075_960095 [Burkholderia vietnamiensis]